MLASHLEHLVLAGWLLAAPALADASGELLLAGSPQQREVVAGEMHAWRVAAMPAPLLLTVQQQGINVVIEVRGPAGEEVTPAAAPNGRWGLEVLVLPAGAGEFQVEIRPKLAGILSGRYTIAVEALAPEADGSGRRRAAEATSRVGQLYPLGTAEALAAAAAAGREALAGWRALGERRLEAELLSTLADLDHQRGDLRAATAGYQQALALWRELGEGRREAATLLDLGWTWLAQGETSAARGAITDALDLWQRLGERFEAGEARYRLCLVEQESGALPAALTCYEQTLALFRELGHRHGEARILSNLGGIYDLLGEPDSALDHYQQALRHWQALGERDSEAQTLNNLAVTYRALGEWQEALRLYGRMREILATSARRSDQGTLLNNLGFSYLTLGQPERALAFLEEALRLRREIGERAHEIVTLNNLGLARRALGELDAALAHHRQALELALTLRDARQEALCRLRLGEVHLERRDAAAALLELEPALAVLSAAGNRRREAEVRFLRGRALALAGRSEDALTALHEALAQRRAQRDRAGEAEALHALAAVERSLGRLDAAQAHAGDAIAVVEELRTGFVSPELRAAFLATRRRAYELAIDLRMARHAAAPAAGHDHAAFALSEQARARTLLDALHAGSSGAVPAELEERRQALRRRLSARAARQLRLGSGDTARAAELAREMDALLVELHGVEAEMRRQDPRYAAFQEPPVLAVEALAELLGPGTLLLEVALGEERSFLWAAGAGGLRSFVLPPQGQIEELTRQVVAGLSTVEAGAARGGEAEALSRLLLAPIWGEMAGVERLLVVPDAALHLLPLSALPVPPPGQGWDVPDRQPLLEQAEVVYLPSATTLALARQRAESRPAAPKWAAVLADPVFDAGDPRLVPAAPRRGGEASPLLPRFERLPASRREAEAIAALAPAGQVWTALDLAASRQTALSGQLRDYRVVHFATHGLADLGNPELSGLVLSLVDAAGQPQDGFLTLADIYELDLAANLVVLSGCRTGAGREVRGEGLMGLTRGFLYAGVPRVLGTLWPVRDRAATELMTRFYQALWQDGLVPAAALRQAQRALRRDPRYRHPFFWAGFVLQGDWR